MCHGQLCSMNALMVSTLLTCAEKPAMLQHHLRGWVGSLTSRKATQAIKSALKRGVVHLIPL